VVNYHYHKNIIDVNSLGGFFYNFFTRTDLDHVKLKLSSVCSLKHKNVDILSMYLVRLFIILSAYLVRLFKMTVFFRF